MCVFVFFYMPCKYVSYPKEKNTIPATAHFSEMLLYSVRFCFLCQFHFFAAVACVIDDFKEQVSNTRKSQLFPW